MKLKEALIQAFIEKGMSPAEARKYEKIVEIYDERMSGTFDTEVEKIDMDFTLEDLVQYYWEIFEMFVDLSKTPKGT